MRTHLHGHVPPWLLPLTIVAWSVWCAAAPLAAGAATGETRERGAACAGIGGNVRAAGRPLAGAKITIERTGAAVPLVVTTWSDSSGAYEADLSPGLYTVRAAVKGFESDLWFAGAAITPVRERASVLDVAGGRTVADFDLGALDLRVALPDLFDGQRAYGAVFLEGVPQMRGKAEADSRRGIRRIFFPALAPGPYTVQITAGSAAVWLDRSLDPAGADTIRIGPGPARDLEATFTAVPLEGTVQGSWQRFGTRNPHIAIYAGKDNEVAYTDADDQGRWAATALAPGPVRMRLDIGAIRRWIGGRSYEDARSFDVPAEGARLPPILESGIECLLQGRTEWKPLRAVAELWTPAGDFLYQDYGEVPRFPNLPPGTYLLRVLPHDPEPWKPQWFDRAAARAAATPVTIQAEGAVVPVRCILEAGGRIRGRVLRADGTAPGRVALRVWSEQFGADDRWRTAPDGSFLIEGLPGPGVKLGALSPEPGPERVTWFPGTAAQDSARVLAIRGAEEVAGIELRLLP